MKGGQKGSRGNLPWLGVYFGCFVELCSLSDSFLVHPDEAGDTLIMVRPQARLGYLPVGDLYRTEILALEPKRRADDGRRLPFAEVPGLLCLGAGLLQRQTRSRLLPSRLDPRHASSSHPPQSRFRRRAETPSHAVGTVSVETVSVAHSTPQRRRPPPEALDLLSGSYQGATCGGKRSALPQCRGARATCG